MKNTNRLDIQKRNASSVSLDLQYPEIVRARIDAAKTENDISRIMIDARNGVFMRRRGFGEKF